MTSTDANGGDIFLAKDFLGSGCILIAEVDAILDEIDLGEFIFAILFELQH